MTMRHKATVVLLGKYNFHKGRDFKSVLSTAASYNLKWFLKHGRCLMNICGVKNVI